jgi:hypothetical protein
MDITNILSRFSRSPIPCFVIVTSITLSCITPAYCGEIHDAAKRGDLAKVQELLKDDPVLVSSKDNNGHTPLHMAAEWRHKDVVEFLLVRSTPRLPVASHLRSMGRRMAVWCPFGKRA